MEPESTGFVGSPGGWHMSDTGFAGGFWFPLRITCLGAAGSDITHSSSSAIFIV
jgi:hypothetical protein